VRQFAGVLEICYQLKPGIEIFSRYLPFRSQTRSSIAIRKTTTNTAHALRPAAQIEVAAVLGTPAALLLEAINYH